MMPSLTPFLFYLYYIFYHPLEPPPLLDPPPPELQPEEPPPPIRVPPPLGLKILPELELLGRLEPQDGIPLAEGAGGGIIITGGLKLGILA